MIKGSQCSFQNQCSVLTPLLVNCKSIATDFSVERWPLSPHVPTTDSTDTAGRSWKQRAAAEINLRCDGVSFKVALSAL